jgi:(2R)-sulfolactate sulfo-lyase subunit beta
MSHGILIHETIDDVGVAVRDLKAGEEVGIVTLEGQAVGTIAMTQDVPLGHKVALRDMPVGHKLLKYGRPIGQVVQPISRGNHVHVHNLKTMRWSLEEAPAPEIPAAARGRAPLKLAGRKAEDMKLLGYRRENGRFGIRNHVIILPVDDISNAAAEGVASLIKGTMALPHPYGRLQFGEDLELTFRTLAGIGRNPNVAAAIVIAIEPKWAQRIADRIAETGKPVAAFSIERYGDLKTIEMAARKAKEFVQWAGELQREPFSVKDLWMSTKCGESDTTSGLASNPTVGRVFERLEAAGATLIFGETTEVTGGEDVIAGQCVSQEVADAFMKFFNDYQALVKSKGVDLLGSQPTEGNIRGGLTTIEEKAMGNIQKMGRCKVVGVLDKAEEPKGPGLHFMDSSSAAAEMVTLCAAAGSVVHFFPTGQGNVIGNPILPVIKLCANPLTVATMSEHIDVDLTGLLRLEINLDQAADKAMDVLERTIRGRLTAAEALRHNEFVLTKLYESA